MKYLRKIISLLMAVAMATACLGGAFAIAQTGTLTISGTTAGKTYALYKVLDLTQSGSNYSYTTNSNFAGFSATITTSSNGSITIERGKLAEALGNAKDASNLPALAQKLAEYALDETNSVSPTKTVKGNDAEGATSTTVNGLEYGYYLLVPFGASGPAEGQSTLFSLNTLSGNDTTIQMKGVYPTVEKTIAKADGTKTTANAASIGDELTFTLTSKVPDMTGYEKYFFIANDTLSKGLTFQSITSVKVGNTALMADTSTDHKTADTGYYLVKTDNNDGTTSLKIVFKNFIQYANRAGDAITITYKAKLNDKAVSKDATTNTAYLTYSNAPTTSGSGSTPTDPTPDEPGTNDPVGESGEVETKTYTASLTINKVDGAGNALTGAKFRISGSGVNMVVTTGDVYVEDNEGTYYKLKDGTYTETDPNGEGVDQTKYESTTVKYAKKASTTITTDNEKSVYAEGFVNSSGKLIFEGLGAGTYTISEIVTPAGYNSIADFTVTISYQEDTGFSATASSNAAITGTDGQFSMDVVNQSGNVLPSTGGMGTTIFYVLGALLMLGAGVLLVTKRRMAK